MHTFFSLQCKVSRCIPLLRFCLLFFWLLLLLPALSTARFTVRSSNSSISTRVPPPTLGTTGKTILFWNPLRLPFLALKKHPAAAAAAAAASSSSVPYTPQRTSSIAGHSWKAALAGSVAGAVATALLYPLDAAKTLRQARGGTGSVPRALRQLIRQGTVYAGLGTALVGAMPSSALYFGAYETAKYTLQRRRRGSVPNATTSLNNKNDDTLGRCLGHATAAAIGNLVSSAVFVPKEHLKQQMQYTGSRHVGLVLRRVLRESGLRGGLYRGYRATVLRNIPSAVVRFTLYEEFRARWQVPGIWAGACAGALASFLLTPLDVIKTKISTGTCPIDVQSCAQHVVARDGIGALWTGAGVRVLSSTLFSAIGLGTFEVTLRWLQEKFPEKARNDEETKKQHR